MSAALRPHDMTDREERSRDGSMPEPDRTLAIADDVNAPASRAMLPGYSVMLSAFSTMLSAYRATSSTN